MASAIESVIEHGATELRVDLKSNRFHGYQEKSRESVDANIRRLLASAKVRWVDVVGNPMASVDRMDVFRNTTVDELKKLIFVPQPWLDKKSWWVLVPGKAEQAAVERAHFEYYATFRA